MFKKVTHQTFWLVSVLFVVSVAVILKGCERGENGLNPSVPEVTETVRIILNDGNAPNSRAKATGLILEVFEIDEPDAEPGKRIKYIEINAGLSFPWQEVFQLPKPHCPCWYRILVTAKLSRGGKSLAQRDFNICEVLSGEIEINTYEDVRLTNHSIDFYERTSVDIDESIEARCQANVDAPDYDRCPVIMTLIEQGGGGQSYQQSYNPREGALSVSGEFPEPQVLPSKERRIFTCTVADGCSSAKTITRSITIDLHGIKSP